MEVKANHTWDISVNYHRCPQCGKILESRGSYDRHEKEYIKKLVCPHCGHGFIEKKAARSTFGPLLGNQQPVEIDWS